MAEATAAGPSRLRARTVAEFACTACGKTIPAQALKPFSMVNCPHCGATQKVPVQLGAFLLLDLLGEGGMGSVYLARDLTLGRLVAVKVLMNAGASADTLKALQAEAQAAARINHPHVARIYSFHIEQDQPFMAMELVPGQHFDDMVAACPEGMNPSLVMETARQIAEGLAAAAENQVIHGDIKPANILFDNAMQAKLVDFGIASLMDRPESINLVGTPYYIAPEKLQRKRADIRSDMYSLGATLFHALAGKPPFDGEDIRAVAAARLEQPTPLLSAVRPGLPAKVVETIRRMMEVESGARHPTYASLLSDIRAAQAQLPPPPARVGVEKQKRTTSLHGMTTSLAGVSAPRKLVVPQYLGARAAGVATPATPVRRSLLPIIAGLLFLLLAASGAIVFTVRHIRLQRARREAARLLATQLAAERQRVEVLRGDIEASLRGLDATAAQAREAAQAESEFDPAPGLNPVLNALRELKSEVDTFNDSLRARLGAHAAVIAPGAVTLQIWPDTFGITLENLRSQMAARAPRDNARLEKLYFDNQGDHYIARVRGFILPPADGDYRFWVSGDDGALFWLGDGPTTAGLRQIAFTPKYTAVNEWEKYPEQASASVTLVGGQAYAFELCHKEDGSKDHAGVAWRIPGQERQLVAAPFLAPWSDDAPPPGLSLSPAPNPDDLRRECAAQQTAYRQQIEQVETRAAVADRIRQNMGPALQIVAAATTVAQITNITAGLQGYLDVAREALTAVETSLVEMTAAREQTRASQTAFRRQLEDYLATERERVAQLKTTLAPQAEENLNRARELSAQRERQTSLARDFRDAMEKRQYLKARSLGAEWAALAPNEAGRAAEAEKAAWLAGLQEAIIRRLNAGGIARAWLGATPPADVLGASETEIKLRDAAATWREVSPDQMLFFTRALLTDPKTAPVQRGELCLGLAVFLSTVTNDLDRAASVAQQALQYKPDLREPLERLLPEVARGVAALSLGGAVKGQGLPYALKLGLLMHFDFNQAGQPLAEAAGRKITVSSNVVRHLTTERAGFLAAGSSYSSVNITPPTDLLKASNLTFSVWYRRATPGNPVQGYLMARGGDADLQGYSLRVYKTDNTNARQLSAKIQARSTVEAVGLLPDDGGWHLVTMTLEGSRLTLYLDGEKVAENASPARPAIAPAEPLLLARGRKSGNSWSGMLDDAMVYDRALTAAEVRALYLLQK